MVPSNVDFLQLDPLFWLGPSLCKHWSHYLFYHCFGGRVRTVRTLYHVWFHLPKVLRWSFWDAFQATSKRMAIVVCFDDAQLQLMPEQKDPTSNVNELSKFPSNETMRRVQFLGIDWEEEEKKAIRGQARRSQRSELRASPMSVQCLRTVSEIFHLPTSYFHSYMYLDQRQRQRRAKERRIEAERAQAAGRFLRCLFQTTDSPSEAALLFWLYNW